MSSGGKKLLKQSQFWFSDATVFKANSCENIEAKKREANTWREQANLMVNGSLFANYSLWSEKNFKRKGRTLLMLHYNRVHKGIFLVSYEIIHLRLSCVLAKTWKIKITMSSCRLYSYQVGFKWKFSHIFFVLVRKLLV